MNPFLFPFVTGVPATDFISSFTRSDAAKTDTAGIGIPEERSWGRFAWQMATNPIGTVATDIQSYITRGVFIAIGLALVIIAIWQLSKPQVTAILETSS